MKWSKGRVRAPILTGFHECAPQDIAAKDAEKARAEVQATAAAKAADKLRKEGVKGEAERQRLAAELEGLKAKFQVQSGWPCRDQNWHPDQNANLMHVESEWHSDDRLWPIWPLSKPVPIFPVSSPTSKLSLTPNPSKCSTFVHAAQVTASHFQ
jgi:hypothetical protein